MKLLTTIITAGVITLSANANAHSTAKLYASDSSQMTEVCMAVASNKPLILIKALRNNRLSMKQANKGILCNGMSLVEFGENHKAHKNIAHLTKHDAPKQLYSAL